MEKRIYIAIDLKSFYASVECMERGLDPLNTNLVVADESKTEKTICLAVTPSLKKYGIPGRARLFEVIAKLKEINKLRLQQEGIDKFRDKSIYQDQLDKEKDLEVSFIAAPPRMAHYIEYSTKIFDVYLKYVSREDIHVYSIDEVFIDATNYLRARKQSAREFAKEIILDVEKTTGITAAGGIGTNMYLAKIAMDIVAKHIDEDQDGVRLALLNEKAYRYLLWDHKPLTDFWRLGRGYQKRLHSVGLYTMGDIARCSLGKSHDYHNEDLLYKMFGVNAELLIDHAWGYESTTIKDIRSYKPKNKSIGHGQVLLHPYKFEDAKIVLKEMIDGLCLDLVEKGIETNQIVLTIGYDIENVDYNFKGEYKVDSFGRKAPKKSHGTINIPIITSSSKIITKEVLDWYDQNVNKNYTLRRINLVASSLFIDGRSDSSKQLMFLTSPQEEIDTKSLEKEKRIQQATLEIKKKFGKNALLKGLSLEDEATARQRNSSIGGHKA